MPRVGSSWQSNQGVFSRVERVWRLNDVDSEHR
jgi:hypothetical protein